MGERLLDTPGRRRAHSRGILNVKRVTRWLSWVIGAPVVAVLALRAFVGNVYYVDSGSMEPLLHGAPTGGDYVFVQFDDALHPRRFDVIVLRRPRERDPLVKRIAGLPGETIQISGGDLFVDGRRLPADAARPPWIPVLDTTLHGFDEHFLIDPKRWSAGPAGHHLDARGHQHVFARARVLKGLDDHLAPDGSRVEGKLPVNDLALEVEFRLSEPTGQLILKLTEEGDTFVVELAPLNPVDATLTLARVARGQDGDREPEKLGVTEVSLRPGAWHRLRLSNRDNELRVVLDDAAPALTHLYTSNTPSPRFYEGGYTNILPRVELGGSNIELDVRAVRIERDLTYFDSGTHATAEPLTLGPDQYLVLGDNSGESVDGREWGPLPRSSLIGVPRAVVWPPARWNTRSFSTHADD